MPALMINPSIVQSSALRIQAVKRPHVTPAVYSPVEKPRGSHWLFCEVHFVCLSTKKKLNSELPKATSAERKIEFFVVS